jgi:GAF domain-containing protein
MSLEEKSYMSVICSVCKHIASRLKLTDVLEILVSESVEALGAAGAAVELIDETSKSFSVGACEGLSETFVGRNQKKPLKSEMDKKVAGGAIVCIPDISKEGKLEVKDLMKKEGLAALLWLPLRVGDVCVGALKLYYSKPTQFTEKDKKMAYTLAATGAIAIHNARLYDRMESLFAVSGSLTSTLNLQQLLDLIVKEATQTMGLKGSTLRLFDEKRANLELKAAYGFSPEYLKRDKTISAQGVKDASEGKPVIIEDASKDPRIMDPEGTAAEGIGAILVVPLKAKDRVIGTLSVMSSVRRKFADDDVQFLAALADHGAIAIENARLYEHIKADYENLSKDVMNWYDWGARPPKTGS